MGTEYIRVLVFIISLIIGIVIGGLLLLLIFHMQNKAYSKRKIRVLKKREKAKAKESKEQQTENSPQTSIKIQKDIKKSHINNRDAKNQTKSRLKQKLEAKEGSSWTEFNCDADEISQHDYIRKIRKREDNAYQYVKKIKANGRGD